MKLAESRLKYIRKKSLHALVDKFSRNGSDGLLEVDSIAFVEIRRDSNEKNEKCDLSIV